MRSQYEQKVFVTKSKIYSAFTQLMHRKNIHNIYITALCSLAEINRSTFYKHFGSQYDVLNEMTDNFLNGLEERLKDISPDDREETEHRVTACLEYMVQNSDAALMLMKNCTGNDFVQRLFTMPKIIDLLNERLRHIENDEKKQGIISFVTYGAFRLILEWVTTPDRADPKEETALILSLARKICD